MKGIIGARFRTALGVCVIRHVYEDGAHVLLQLPDGSLVRAGLNSGHVMDENDGPLKVSEGEYW